MLTYLIRRVLWAFVLFIAVTVVTYVIFFIIPANPAALVCGRTCNAEALERAERFLGVDEPVHVQYARFLERLLPVTFDLPPKLKTPSLGTSFSTRRDVNEVVLTAAPVTASLVLGGALVWLLIGLSLGILSALRPRSLLDRAGMVFVLVGISAHPVWIGLILAYLFGYKLGWTPITGYCDFINPSTGCGGPVEWAYHMLLPWLTFAVLYAATYTRMTRASVMETLAEDYVRTARAKGAPEARVIRSHVLRNALLPITTMLGLDIGLALGGAIFTETVFGLPGLGQIALESIQGFDLPVTQGIVVFGTISILVFNLVVDLLYAVIDPRIRIS